MKKLTQTGLLLLLFFCVKNTNAQLEAFLIDGEAWARGNLVEIGINSKGVFGANYLNIPPLFHSNREDGSNGIFGFIANPAADGWIDYDGGFFSPGAPEEGFNIEINGENYGNNNVDDLFEIPGEIINTNIISSDCNQDTVKILWQGKIEGLLIKRYYTITEDGLFIKMETVIENISDSIKENVFFMHNVDPDNNVTLNGRFDTDMEIIAQANSNDGQISLVTASQDPTGIPEDMDGSKISFYTNHSNARVTYGGFSNRSASNVWNGTLGLFNTQGNTLTNIDKAISIAFKLNDIAPTNSVSFTYYYVLEEIDQTFEPIIVNITKEHPNTCDGDEGKLILSNLSPNQTYTVDFNHNGTIISDLTYNSNSNGTLEITNLSIGNYSEIILSLSGCITSISGDFELEGPEPPLYSLEKSDITDCENVNGKIKILELSQTTDYYYEFSYNGTLVGPINSTSNINGEIIIDNLQQGTYSDFVVTKLNTCASYSHEIIEINTPPIENMYLIPEQFYCDDNSDYIISINLSNLNHFILGSDSSSDYEISYHFNEINAISNISLPNTSYETSGDESFTLYAKKTNLNDFCSSYSPFTVTINTPLEFSLNNESICVNSNGSTNFEYNLPIISTGLPLNSYNFEWYFENNIIPDEHQNTLVADQPGNYSVIVTNLMTECQFMESSIITPSGPPEEIKIETISEPFSRRHAIEIITNGLGNYQYAMDDGTYQTSPLFYEIPTGFHTFSIRDINGCGTLKKEKTLMDYLQHFSPNNDGIFDLWTINTQGLNNPEIYIYNKKGKLIKQLKPNSKGWDGTYKNRELPTSDYWFKVLYLDTNNNRKQFMANFTLKR